MFSFLRWSVIGIYFLTFCREGSAVVDCSANQILNRVQSGNVIEVFDAFEFVGKELQQTEKPFAEAQKFLQALIDAINTQYGMSLTKQDACRLIQERVHLIPLPHDSRIMLLTVLRVVEQGENVITVASDDLCSQEAQARIFRRGLYWPWEWNWFGLNQKGHKLPQASSSTSLRDVEFVLPPKMSAGFMCALGGALLCIIPGGQGVGLTLIGTGIGLALDGMANGERPYYVDIAPPAPGASER